MTEGTTDEMFAHIERLKDVARGRKHEFTVEDGVVKFITWNGADIALYVFDDNYYCRASKGHVPIWRYSLPLSPAPSDEDLEELYLGVLDWMFCNSGYVLQEHGIKAK